MFYVMKIYSKMQATNNQMAYIDISHFEVTIYFSKFSAGGHHCFILFPFRQFHQGDTTLGLLQRLFHSCD